LARRRDNMLNQVVLVGRLVKNPELQVTDSGKKITKITLAVPRSYKNVSGEYDTDFLDCTLWTNVAENTTEYCQSGDMIGVKGRIQNRIIESADGTKKKKTEIIAEKVTFLATAPKNKPDKKMETKQQPKKKAEK
jgi:single-strand DNA-binding protein